ncbi:MAG: RpiB/LacA/LacB family sugar-phosphate isomerase [Candidatus Levybacteria bacterium]|nr:RpiB/LacA/LacB family sugar-phosphate isomerase [Candidatus Levybacteria bacterium]
MKVYIGADHRGFELKEGLKTWFTENKIEIKDLGAFKYDPGDDYPVYAEQVARHVATDLGRDFNDSRGILICGSGVGVDIVANKFKHIRSGLAVNPEQIEKARLDDDINVLTIPADYINEQNAKIIVKLFLETPFSHEKKKERRLAEIEKIENEQ